MTQEEIQYNKRKFRLNELYNQAKKRGFTQAEEDEASRLLDYLENYERMTGNVEQRNAILGYGQKLSNTTVESPFPNLGTQLQAVVRAAKHQEIDDRLHEIRAATGLSEGIGSDGGFVVAPQYSNQILEKSYMTGEILRRCFRMNMKSNRLSVPVVDETSRADGSRHGGVRGYWTAEAATKTASQPKFGKIELNTSKMVVLVYTTDELLEDAGALEAYIRKAASTEIQFMIENAIINGSGGGQPLGILNAGCLVTAGAEVGQAAATFLYENAIAMWSRMYGPSRKNAVWLINQDVEPELYAMALAVGAGGAPVFMPGGGASERPYATLFGRPIVPCEYCQTLGTVGDVVLADFGEYLYGQRGGLQADMSIHVEFLTDQSVFRFVVRLDGQPTWGSDLTPLHGATNTVSPFVALETRS